MFLKLHELKQDYIVCLTKKRKLFFHGKWVPATELCNRRKGKLHPMILVTNKVISSKDDVINVAKTYF